MPKAKRKDSKPFKAQKRTYLQGTILRLFEHHCEQTDQTASEFLRQLSINFLKATYDIQNTGGIVKIKR